MNDKNEDFEPVDFLQGEGPGAEGKAFRREEALACGKCARTNPSNRLKCFYCGAELEISVDRAENIQPVWRRPENWEKGFNLIFAPPRPRSPEPSNPEIADLLGLESEIWEKINEAGKSLPLARAESKREAEIVRQRLRKLGVESVIVSDEQLAAEKLPRRLRGLQFEEDRLWLILFNTDEVVEIEPGNLRLIVTGAIFEKTIESIEKRQKGENKMLESSETATDQTLLDLYDQADRLGYRILIKGFDFSCLGAEKGILARENIKKLIGRLQEFAPQAKLDDDYLGARELLGHIWELDRHQESQGLKRQGFAKFGVSNLTLSNNLQQFTKYSRLRRLIL